MSEQRKTDAVNYLKEVLRDAEFSNRMPRDVQVMLGEMILRAYLRGRDDAARDAAGVTTEGP
jgi:hypothetical protein